MGKRKAGESQAQEAHSEYIATICSAAVRFTKSLLGYGAENNWEDVAHSKGRSWNAGDARREWQYLSKKLISNEGKRLKFADDEAGPADSPPPRSTSQPYFFYNPSHEVRDVKLNYIARKATAAVLAATGACDQHAYVLAMLLRMLLPPGVPINICAMHDHRKSEDFSHTFVVLGDIQKESSRFSSPVAQQAYGANDNLWVVDAWPITGGVVKMRDFWLRDKPDDDFLPRTIRTDCTFLSDGVDHLLKRVEKQKRLYAQLHHDQVIFSGQWGQIDPPTRVIHKQKNIHDHIIPVPLAGYEQAHGMWSAPSVVKEGMVYREPPRTREVMISILETHHLLRALLDEVDEKLADKQVLPRKGTGFTP